MLDLAGGGGGVAHCKTVRPFVYKEGGSET